METHRFPHIGILKHEKVGYGEAILKQVLETSNCVVSIIQPQYLVFGNGVEFPDLVVARCELSSLSENILTGYLAYMEECRVRSIPIINPKEFLLRAQHKYLTHLALQGHLRERNITDTITLPTYCTSNRDGAFAVAVSEIDEFGSVVIKRPCSGRGEGVFLATNHGELSDLLRNQFKDGEEILIQRTVEKERNGEKTYRDIRLNTCRNSKTGCVEVVSAYYRNAPQEQFRTNISQGGFVSKIDKVDEALEYFAGLVMDATCGDVAGIDFMRDVEGQYKFLEINSAFETPQKSIEITGIGIWERVRDLVQSTLHLSS